MALLPDARRQIMYERGDKMKKITALALVLIMILALCACGGSKSPAGNWELKSMEHNGETRSVEDYPNLAGTVELTLNEDGTGTMLLSGSANDLKWDDKNLNMDDGEVFPYTLSGDTLSFTVVSDGTYIVNMIRK
jgi:hypothetical protein